MEVICNYSSLHLKPPPSTPHLHFLTPNHLPFHQKFTISKPNSFKQSPPFPSKNPHRKRKSPKPFTERDAFPSSARNPAFIYRDIQKLALQNKLKEAATILDFLDHKGIPVNPTTFNALIAACVRLKSLDFGKLVHTHIRINGLDSNDFLRTKLVHMYSACGSMEDARRVFDEMPTSTVYPWNALLRGNVILGGRRHTEVLSTYSHMRELGLELNVYTFSCLIKSLAGASALHQGFKAHALLIKNGFFNNPLISTSLIDMYFKCGKVRLAGRVFEEVGQMRDVVVWGAMIAGFAHNRLRWEALEYTRWMTQDGIDPNSVILTTILPVIGDVRGRKLGQEVHAYVIKTKEYSKQLFIQSGLVDMYCKCGDMDSGRKVFYGSMERNTISWTSLMSGYVRNGRLEQALRSIIWMQQEGFKPDVVTIATVLPVCGEMRALKQGKEIHSFAVKNGFSHAISIATSLMMMYSKCGILDYSSKIFNTMESRNVISWTSMIESYIQSELLFEALGIFRSMLLSKHRPDSVAMARMLTVCGKLGALKLGKEIHGQVLRRDFEQIPFVSSEIVKMYGICGETKISMVVFNAVPVKGSMTWTAIIEAHGYNGMHREAMYLFKKMISGGFSPNHFTLKVVLLICKEAGFADEACRVFKLLTRRFKVKATDEHYDIIIELLNNVGLIREAQRFSQLRSSSS